MILVGPRYAVPVIKTAKQLGIYTITADFLPDNIAHKFSDEYVNVSIIDKDKTLEVAEKLKIDGIVLFACDMGVLQRHILLKKGLPFQGSYESTKILQDKGLFRDFLTKQGFNVPHAKRYTDKNAPFNDVNFFSWPVIVKLIDSAGSKGVTKVDTPDELSAAIETAVWGLHNGVYIIWKSSMTKEGQDYLTKGTQSLLNLLDM